jgi:hypothetical protein
MVLSLIAYTVIDVGFGVSWWVAKKTMNGIYYGTLYLIYGSKEEAELTESELLKKDILEELKLIKLKMSDK